MPTASARGWIGRESSDLGIVGHCSCGAADCPPCDTAELQRQGHLPPSRPQLPTAMMVLFDPHAARTPSLARLTGVLWSSIESHSYLANYEYLNYEFIVNLQSQSCRGHSSIKPFPLRREPVVCGSEHRHNRANMAVASGRVMDEVRGQDGEIEGEVVEAVRAGCMPTSTAQSFDRSASWFWLERLPRGAEEGLHRGALWR